RPRRDRGFHPRRRRLRRPRPHDARSACPRRDHGTEGRRSQWPLVNGKWQLPISTRPARRVVRDDQLPLAIYHLPMSSSSSRRTFLQQTAAATTLVALHPFSRLSAAATPTPSASAAPSSSPPWYRRTLRWGQTNITELDPTRYDIPWWREHWRRTETQGVVINAGGIVAYYPTAI